jgi:glycosyltransferase involved in cell wall biosynthesis
MSKRLVLIPVFNEERHIEGLLSRLREVFSGDVLFIDDGSRDRSPEILRSLEGPSTFSILHAQNRGYGGTLLHGFAEAHARGYEYLITMDSDGQHRPDWVPVFFERIPDWDIVSGSRYCKEMDGNGSAPPERRRINAEVTELINSITGFSLTDSFCGFKAYRVSALPKLALTETGYGMPLQVWLQARKHRLRVTELPVSRIYDDPNRRFGGDLDDPEVRLRYYRTIIEGEKKRCNL